jgi:hypothetical protein
MAANDEDRGKRALLAVIMSAMPGLEYHLQYPCRVVSQDSSDQTLDLHPDDPDAPQMQGVPLRKPFPDCDLFIKPGSRVVMIYEEGDPKKPAAVAWDMGSVSKIRLGADIYEVDGTTITLNAPNVTIGPTTAAIHPLLLSLIYRPAEDAMLTAMGAQLTALAATLATAAAAVTAAAAALQTATPALPALVVSCKTAGAALAPAGPALVAAGPLMVALNASIAAFQAAAESYKSQNGKNA